MLRRAALPLLTAAAAGAEGGMWNCPPVAAPPPPADVTQLHPAHVSVVMAMGDSITAAFSARSNLYESRDISWSVGSGSAENLTVPWMLSQYSPLVEGQSTKVVIPRDITKLPHNDYHPATDHLNVAESSGAVHRGSLDEQWAFLLEQFPKYSNFSSRWKMLTVWMAANDVCGQCDHDMDLDPYAAKFDELLSNVTSTLNNVYVNLVTTLDLSNIARIQRKHLLCTAEHKVVLKECGCIDRGDDKQLAQLDTNIHAMNARTHAIAADWQKRTQGRKDIYIGTQPFMESIGPELDISFLSSLDCFHPSTVGHQSLALGLWNSMLCTQNRTGRCGIHFSPQMPPTCPTADSVLYTGPDVVPGPPPPRGWGAATVTPAPEPPPPAAVWRCGVCNHQYDPAADPADGCARATPPCTAAKGTAFADLPDSWVCPVCGAPKSAYKPSVAGGRRVWAH